MTDTPESHRSALTERTAHLVTDWVDHRLAGHLTALDDEIRRAVKQFRSQIQTEMENVYQEAGPVEAGETQDLLRSVWAEVDAALPEELNVPGLLREVDAQVVPLRYRVVAFHQKKLGSTRLNDREWWPPNTGTPPAPAATGEHPIIDPDDGGMVEDIEKVQTELQRFLETRELEPGDPSDG